MRPVLHLTAFARFVVEGLMPVFYHQRSVGFEIDLWLNYPQ